MSSARLKENFLDATKTLEAFVANENNLKIMSTVASAMAHAFKNGNKVISCGNGGSMCDAMHFAEELSGRFRKDRKALPAMAISDPAHITCVANDFGFDHIFSRDIEAFGKNGDILLAISTSGNSPNIIRAVATAKEKGIKTLGLLGKGGGKLLDQVDYPLVIENAVSDRIQEMHIKIIHMLIEEIERELFPENY